MATYRVRATPAAQRQLERLPAPIQLRIRITTRALADDPRPPGAALLTGEGTERVWRIRVGDYRILYQVRDDQLLVLVIRAGPRREIERPDPHGGRSWTSQLVHLDPPA